MGLYYLADSQRIFLDRRGEDSFLSEPRKEGFFRLFNKNAGRTTFVKPVGQMPNMAVWIVEADEPIDPYFQHVLKPVNAE